MNTRRGPRPAPERLRRLLVILPWIMRRGRVTVSEVAERFDVDRDELVRDLELAAMCGLPPYTDELIDLFIEDEWIEVGVPRLFTRPRRLTPQEGFALVAAGRAALALPGADQEGPLATALTKLEAVLGARPELAVDMEAPESLADVERAREQHVRLAITYYAAWRDAVTERTINPLAVFSVAGRWYVIADDSISGSERLFRIDRIDSARLTNEHFEPRAVSIPDSLSIAAGDDTVEATIVIPPEARWIVETYPVEHALEEPDGRWRVTLIVASARFLERLLLRAGPTAEVVAPPEWRDLGPRAARRLLERYR